MVGLVGRVVRTDGPQSSPSVHHGRTAPLVGSPPQVERRRGPPAPTSPHRRRVIATFVGRRCAEEIPERGGACRRTAVGRLLEDRTVLRAGPRSEYWWWYLFVTLVLSSPPSSTAPPAGARRHDVWRRLDLPASPASPCSCPNLAVGVRRLRDTGRSGWWLHRAHLVHRHHRAPVLLHHRQRVRQQVRPLPKDSSVAPGARPERACRTLRPDTMPIPAWEDATVTSVPPPSAERAGGLRPGGYPRAAAEPAVQGTS